MRTSFILHFDMMPTVDLLSNAELGKVIKAVYHYNVNGELPEKLSTSSSILFQRRISVQRVPSNIISTSRSYSIASHTSPVASGRRAR